MRRYEPDRLRVPPTSWPDQAMDWLSGPPLRSGGLQWKDLFAPTARREPIRETDSQINDDTAANLGTRSKSKQRLWI